jgi:transposase
MWSLKGQQPEIYTHGGRKRQPLIGAVDPIGGNLHVALTDGLKAEQFQHFLEGLLARYPPSKRLVIVLDNARVHHAKQLAPFLKRNEDRIELSYLPPYSPDLNPMEWCWKFLRKEVTHNTFFIDFKSLKREIVKFVLKHKRSSLRFKKGANCLA